MSYKRVLLNYAYWSSKYFHLNTDEKDWNELDTSVWKIYTKYDSEYGWVLKSSNTNIVERLIVRILKLSITMYIYHPIKAMI